MRYNGGDVVVMHWAISFHYVAFIHQNSKRPKFSFASKAIVPKALRSFDLWCELPQLNYAYYPLLLDINLSQLLPLN
jgi:hypothetical protein